MGNTSRSYAITTSNNPFQIANTPEELDRRGWDIQFYANGSKLVVYNHFSLCSKMQQLWIIVRADKYEVEMQKTFFNSYHTLKSTCPETALLHLEIAYQLEYLLDYGIKHGHFRLSP
jgi:hypothetical protein